ncbi:MAG: aminoacyl--tRNA ligase-related protein [Bdellovibrionota bacterium]
MQAQGLAYEVDPGEGVFYGPKIDIKIKDSIGRMWQCSTIQADFVARAFRTRICCLDGSKKTPITIHRALLGSIERFFGILVEHYAGQFPFWLAPEQVRILNITDAHLEYAHALKHWKVSGYRASVDARNEKLDLKFKYAQLDKLYMLIVGDEEVKQQNCSLRTKGQEQKVKPLRMCWHNFNFGGKVICIETKR